jgi:DNA-directed RNA polymerase subunit RPC12/RpoP
VKISEMEMAYKFYCPRCSSPIYTDGDLKAGDRVWCEYCDQYTTVEE